MSETPTTEDAAVVEAPKAEAPKAEPKGFDALKGMGTLAEDAVVHERKVDAQGRSYAFTGEAEERNRPASGSKPGKGKITINEAATRRSTSRVPCCG